MISIYFTDTITVIRPKYDTRGAETTAGIFYHSCRCQSANKTILGADGKGIQTHYKIFLLPSADIQPGDRIIKGRVVPPPGTNPAELADQQWPVISISFENGFSGNHLEVIC